MAVGFPTDWLEELKSKCGIVEVVSQYVPLTKRSGKHFGCCPFHNEKTGSFCVNEDGQFYHCFGCGESGDVVKFIMEMESCTFWDAVKLLAERVNMELPEFTHGENVAIKKDKKDLLENCMHSAFEYYYKNLRTAGGKDALDYLKKRKISEEFCNYYGIGLSLSYEGMTSFLRRKGYTVEILRECGLIEGENNNDAFSNRIIVPILNSMGKVVAFGGRIYHGEENRPKYKNSTNTLLFDKSRTLYGLNFVKAEKKKNGLSEIILVEGYMDVIALGSHKIMNAVAGMGTALTVGQAKELVRLCKNVLVCYDSDEAGKKAAIKNVETLSNEGAEVKIITLPEGKDPDDYVREVGADGFLRLAAEALPLVDFKLKLCENAYGLSSANARAKYATAAVKVLSAIENETERAVYINEVAKRCGVNSEILASQVKRESEQLPKQQQNQQPQSGVINDTNAGNIIAEQCVLHYVLFNREFAKFEQLQKEWFTNPVHNEIFDLILRQKENKKTVNAGILYSLMQENEEMNAVINLALKLENEKQEEKYYTDSAVMIANLYLTKLITDIGARYENESDASGKKSLLVALATAQQKLKLTSIAGKKLNFGEDHNNNG
ncbi:MAG TPA: DNA primase [Clostridia bacterium]|nr:DNA primase [Clostridia bacterium]